MKNAPDLWALAAAMEKSLKMQQVNGENAFLGSHAVSWMVSSRSFPAKNVDEAVKIGSEMIVQNMIWNASQRNMPFRNSTHYYSFTPCYRVTTRLSLTVDDLRQIAGRLMGGIEVSNREFVVGDDGENGEEVTVSYPDCFVGQEATKWMIVDPNIPVSTVAEACDMGNFLILKAFLSYGVDKTGTPNFPFANEPYCYRFAPQVVPIAYDEQTMKLYANECSESTSGSTLGVLIEEGTTERERILENENLQLRAELHEYKRREEDVCIVVEHLQKENKALKEFVCKLHGMVK